MQGATIPSVANILSRYPMCNIGTWIKISNVGWNKDADIVSWNVFSLHKDHAFW